MSSPFQKPGPADAATSAALVTALLQSATPVTFKANGPSMHPTIRDGDNVRLRPVGAGDLRPGAILLYAKGERLVLHRLVGRDRATGRLRLSGDAALDGCDLVSTDAVLGVAEWVQRGEPLRRLDSAPARWRGRLRHLLRPLRRLLHG